MSLTLASYVLLPLAALLPLLPLRWSMTLLVIGASMPNVAVLLLPFFGLSPGYLYSLVLLLMNVRWLARIDVYVFRVGLLLFLVLAMSLVAFAYGFLLPHDDILVLSGRIGQDIHRAERYTPRIENLNQYAYLLANVGFFMVYANRLAHLPPDYLRRAVTTALDVGMIFVTIVCIMEFTMSVLGINQRLFNDFFYSNPFYGTAYDQAFFGRFNRVNGPFLEPSHLGYALSGYLFYYLSRLAAGDTARGGLGLVACVALAMVSFSTTAFLAIGIAVLVMAVIAARALLHNSRRSVILGGGLVLVLLAASLLGGLILSAYPSDSDQLIRYILVGKVYTESFAVRSDVENLGISVFVQSNFMGLGLGAHRANSLVVTLLSNIGILGLGSVVAFFGYLLIPGSNYRRTSDKTERHVTCFLLGLALMHMISNPNFADQYLWITATLLAALRATGSAAAPQPAAAPERLPAAVARAG